MGKTRTQELCCCEENKRYNSGTKRPVETNISVPKGMTIYANFQKEPTADPS